MQVLLRGIKQLKKMKYIKICTTQVTKSYVKISTEKNSLKNYMDHHFQLSATDNVLSPYIRLCNLLFFRFIYYENGED